MGALGVPGVLTPAAPASGGGAGGSTIQGTWIDATTWGQWGALIPRADSPFMSELGCLEGVAAYNGNSFAITFHDDRPYYRIDPGSSVGLDGFIEGPQQHRVGGGLELFCAFRFGDADRSRMWIGFFDVAGGSLGASNPGSQTAALRFEDGDAEFTFYQQNGASNEAVLSGVVPSNDTDYFYRLSINGTGGTHTLFDASMNELASQVLNTTIPNTATLLRANLYTQNEAVGAQRLLDIGFLHVLNRWTA